MAKGLVARKAGIPQGVTVVIGAFLPIMAIVSMFPAVPSLVAHFQDDPTASWKVPWMVTAPGLAIGLVSPFAGILVDKFGRRRPALWATFFYGVLGMAPLLLDSLDAIFASRILLGVCEGVIMTTLTTLIADYWEGDGRRHWLTVQGIFGPLFASLLILSSGYLVAVHWNAVFLVYLIAFPIYLSMLLCMFEPDNDEAARKMFGMDEEDFSGQLPRATFAKIIGVTLLSSIIYYAYIVNGGLAFSEVGVRSSSDLGRITFLPSMAVVLGAIVFWLMASAAAWVRFMVMFACLGMGMLVMGLAPDWKLMVAGMTIQQVGAGMAVPVLLAWAQEQLPLRHRGRGMGIWTACFFIGQFISPPVVTLIQGQVHTMQAAFTTIGVIALLSSLGTAMIALTTRSPQN